MTQLRYRRAKALSCKIPPQSCLNLTLLLILQCSSKQTIKIITSYLEYIVSNLESDLFQAYDDIIVALTFDFLFDDDRIFDELSELLPLAVRSLRQLQGLDFVLVSEGFNFGLFCTAFLLWDTNLCENRYN